ncbi:MAG: thioredoxin domain-containing protein [Pirellulaceae bacterium]|nr:thioredoxin domain-containing protein [Pirellulaceae bacterium]
MPNRLVNESSPYLLQHANNPVDWYPWCDEVLRRARVEQKPIFLSIGYSACHWCHVMEHESFENQQLAAELNQHFLCVKVDREERPDLDQIYMHAVMIMNGGRGGWPMSVFLTPDLQPFYGGTYWPPSRKMGMPGFDEVLRGVWEAWNERRDDAIAHAQQLTERIAGMGASGVREANQIALNDKLLVGAARQLQRLFDAEYGGFGAAPKFPHAMDLQLLLRVSHRKDDDAASAMVKRSLDRMAAGGIYDHLGGGFARYSVDQRWLVPHFEKMLYDNALLAGSYLDSFLATGDEGHARVVRETLDYLLREMTDAEGGFYSTEDADSEGVEGKYYVWSKDQIEEILGAEIGSRFCTVYDVSAAGNFEGQNILNLPKTISQVAADHDWELSELSEQLAAARNTLRKVREQRVRPGRDDKVIVSWNGLAIDVFARAARTLAEPRYLKAAEAAAQFMHQQLRESNGRLLHCWRSGEAKLMAYLDDYVTLANGLISLYEAGFQEHWVDWAVELAERVLKHFSDSAGGPLFYTADDHETLIARTKDLQDGSVPSGNSMAAYLFLRLGKLTGRGDFLQTAESILLAGRQMMHDSPPAVGQLLLALDLYLGPFHELVVIGDPQQSTVASALRDLSGRFLPRSVLACRPVASTKMGTAALDPIFAGKESFSPPTVFLCQDFACRPPIEGEQPIKSLWNALSEETDGSQGPIGRDKGFADNV